MSKAWNPDDIFDVLASEDVRQILVATNVQSMSVKELADICDRSLATIYRRIQAMENYNLVSEEITRDADGTQYSEYKSELNEITISVEEGQLDININIEKDTVDQFAELIEDLEQSQKQDGQSDTDS
ncbi:ArsR/SmtB family transcription factor [Haloquadratum walsbyi]|uniref:ArsR family transcription regulator n=1 Tax=Haloquadratum walsbyi (strain DSM 16790 / HBSQ001) TaxID=362976 RepID=Q18IU0_HALWD|nr:helix-turn-helix domain-containing protein [Haloquadratum walsbyi]CAJ52077.1 ArsR family transcription regulator [Haloquadratum walsbyi DSM 16790]